MPATKKVYTQEFATAGQVKTTKQTIQVGRGGRQRAVNMVYDHHWQKVVQNLQGLQGVFLVNTIMANTDYDETNSNAVMLRNVANRYGTDLYQMTPRYQTSTQDQGIYPIDVDIVANNDEFYLNNIQSTLNLTNFSNSSGTVEIY